MKSPGTGKISIIIAIVLLLLFLFANIYTVRNMGLAGVEMYLYDKLLVAYQVGGMDAMKAELEKTLSTSDMPHELAAAKEFKDDDLPRLKDPEKFLEDKVAENRRRIASLRDMRRLSFGVIIILLLVRLAVNAASLRRRR